MQLQNPQRATTLLLCILQYSKSCLASHPAWARVLSPLHRKYEQQQADLATAYEGLFLCNTTAQPELLAKYPWAHPMKYADKYCGLHERFAEEVAYMRENAVDCQVVFYGDSLFSSLRWTWAINEKSDEVFKKYTKQYNAVSFGIGMDSTAGQMWRMLGGEAPINMGVKLVVLHTGMNDVWGIPQLLGKRIEDPEFARNMLHVAAINEASIAQYLVEADTQLQVLIMGPLPPNRIPGAPDNWEDRYQHPNWLTEPVEHWGKYLAVAAKKVNEHVPGPTRIHYTSCWKTWAPDDATSLNPDWTEDGVHPNAKGWEVLFKNCLAPAIERIMGY